MSERGRRTPEFQAKNSSLIAASRRRGRVPRMGLSAPHGVKWPYGRLAPAGSRPPGPLRWSGRANGEYAGLSKEKTKTKRIKLYG